MRILLSGLALVSAFSDAAAADTSPKPAPAPRSVECIAAFELMERAAPRWTAQTSVQKAWQGWEGEALRLTDQAAVDFGTQINREMTTLADLSAQNPGILSERAMQCVADTPL